MNSIRTGLRSAELFSRMRNCAGILILLFLGFTVPLVAQDTHVSPPETQIAAEETPAAAANAEELRNAAQNPIARLISVPVQSTWNVGIGPADRTQNVTLIQPVIPVSVSQDWRWFINCTMKKGWNLITAPIITTNWRAGGDNVWTTPFGGGVGRIMRVGFQPVNISAQFYGNAICPTGA